jgi:hypothetical protein
MTQRNYNATSHNPNLGRDRNVATANKSSEKLTEYLYIKGMTHKYRIQGEVMDKTKAGNSCPHSVKII